MEGAKRVTFYLKEVIYLLEIFKIKESDQETFKTYDSFKNYFGFTLTLWNKVH